MIWLVRCSVFSLLFWWIAAIMNDTNAPEATGQKWLRSEKLGIAACTCVGRSHRGSIGQLSWQTVVKMPWFTAPGPLSGRGVVITLPRAYLAENEMGIDRWLSKAPRTFCCCCYCCCFLQSTKPFPACMLGFGVCRKGQQLMFYFFLFLRPVEKSLLNVMLTTVYGTSVLQGDRCS